MTWIVQFFDEFRAEFSEYHSTVQDAIYARLLVLEKEGPALGRPLVDTLNDSKHANMKELRVTVDKAVWRLAFAFDPQRQAILLTAGDKTSAN